MDSDRWQSPDSHVVSAEENRMHFLVAAAELQRSHDDQLELVEDNDASSRPAESSSVFAGNEGVQLPRTGMCALLSLLHKLTGPEETQGNAESMLASTQNLQASALSDTCFPSADQFSDSYDFSSANQFDPYNFPLAHRFFDPYNFPLVRQLGSFELPPVAGDLLLGSNLGDEVTFNF